MSRLDIALQDSDEESITVLPRENADNEKVADKGTQNGEGKGANVPEVELLKAKRARVMRPFTEDLLVGQYGLQVIYNEFPLKCKYPGRGHEGKYLKNLLSMYKEWAFQLHPGLSFEDVLQKCDTLSSRAQVRSYMGHLRDVERDRYVSEVLVPMHEEKLAAEKKLRLEKKAASKKRKQAQDEHSLEQAVSPYQSPAASRSHPIPLAHPQHLEESPNRLLDLERAEFVQLDNDHDQNNEDMTAASMATVDDTSLHPGEPVPIRQSEPDVDPR